MGNDWKRMPLGSLISLQRGHDLPSQSRVKGSIPIMGSSGVTGWHNTPKCKGPGIVVGRSGNSMGVVSYSESDFWPLNTCLYVTDFKGNDVAYIYYMLQQIDFDQFNSGSAQKSLNRNAVYPFEVLATKDKNEQHRIGKMLSDFERKITLNRQINQTLEQMAQALFKSWFVDFDPVVDNALDAGFFAENSDLPEALLRRAEQRKVVRQRPDFTPLPAETRQLFPAAFEACDEPSLGIGGWVPQGWRAVTIKSLCVKTQNGGTPKRANSEYWDDGDIPWLTSGEVRQSIITHVENRITKIGLDNSSAKWIPVYSTLVALYGATAGEVSINALSLTTNQAVCALIPKDGYCWFNYLFVKSKTKLMQNNAVGSAQQNISKGLVEDLVVLSPTFNVATYFNSLVSDLFIKNISNSKQNQSLSNLRDTLLPKLIAGELRLNDNAPAVGTDNND
ncbi:restriction endonuclease subunit S [Edwardsiella anguillarum]|uniref:restriction endonuclease subunit S n=1 Tax=Edwardsiella anguillarum TaxID=1821960 RepID=UPI0024B76D1B|nr:restriction endonuclease subunit S [Edwardsiella anguillarum]WHQ15513.1 restriction endonuclease subunit S [Edwardsiella anguillarum]